MEREKKAAKAVEQVHLISYPKGSKELRAAQVEQWEQMRGKDAVCYSVSARASWERAQYYLQNK